MSSQMPKVGAPLAPDVDPEIKRFVAITGAAYGKYPDLATLPVTEARRICEEVRAPWVKGGPVMPKTSEMTIPTRNGPVRVRIHDPLPGETKPAFVYLHGGGWTVFSLDTHDRLMREYAHRAQMAVVGVDYALSPEVKFPTALEQIVDVLTWLSKEGASLDIDPKRLAVGGDSAGGTLSVGACLMLRDRGDASLVSAMVLNYGAFDYHLSDESIRRYGGPGYMLTADERTNFFGNYLRSDADIENPLVCPIKADLAGLPPTLLIIPECDILTEQSHALAEKLIHANVSVESKVYRGATHSFLEAMSISAIANRAISDTTLWLRTVLTTAQK